MESFYPGLFADFPQPEEPQKEPDNTDSKDSEESPEEGQFEISVYTFNMILDAFED